MTALANAMKAHALKLAELEAKPEPRSWEDRGSIEYHREAIVYLSEMIEKQEAAIKAAG